MIERLIKLKDQMGGSKNETTIRGRNELLPSEYYSRLSREEKWDVEGWLDFINRLNERPGKHFYAVIATGSILRPEKERDHDPEDIDLRILHSSAYDSTARKVALYELQISLFDNLMGSGREYNLLPPNPTYAMEQSPSFLVKTNVGRPVHISYPNDRAWDANKYIQIERDEENYFAELINPSRGVNTDSYNLHKQLEKAYK